MVNALDSALKISEQMKKQSHEEALKAKNNEKEILLKLEECDKNEKTLIAKLNEMKQINGILKEVSKFTNLKELSKCDTEKLKELCSSESFIALYSNICAGNTMIDVIINMIKTDSFSVQYQSNADGLKTLNNNIVIQIASIQTKDSNYVQD